MNEIEEYKEKELTSLTSARNLSPYDPSYPIVLLSEGLNSGIEEAEEAAHKIYNEIVKNAPVGTELKKLEKDARYVVDISDELFKQIEAGNIKLTTNKAGQTFAQILDANNKFGKKLPIKKETFAMGADPSKIAMAMQLKAMQKQLDKIEKQIDTIDRSVKDVIQGQQNDRIANYYSGISLFIEAREIEDDSLRNALLSQALKALSDASFQLRLQLQMDIAYLLNKDYKNEKGKRVLLIDTKMNEIHQEFAYIHQTALLKAGIYCSKKEYSSMIAVLDEYSFFLEHNIAANSHDLAQCDVTDDGTNKGIWESRSQLKLDTKELKKQLCADDKVIYLGVMKEGTPWEKQLKDA